MRRAGFAIAFAAVAAGLLGPTPAPAAYVTGGQWGTGGSAAGQLQSPSGLAVDAAGRVYVADTGNHRVQVFGSGGALLDQWGEQGSDPGEFESPSGIEVDLAGNVYVADTGNDRIQKFETDGDFLTQWGTSGADPLEFNGPRGVAEAAGDVYVSDAGNNRVTAFDTAGAFSHVWGSAGDEDGELDAPRGLTVGGGGVVVADFGNDRLQAFTTGGTFIDAWTFACFSICIPFSEVEDVAADLAGDLFAVNPGLVLKLEPNGDYIARFGGGGELAEPRGIDVSASGRVYVVDGVANRVVWFHDDRTAPTARIVRGPKGLTRKRRARFVLASSEAGSSFSCRLDRRPFLPCSSPKTYRGLTPGRHVFRARASDRALNPSAIVKRAWRVRRP